MEGNHVDQASLTLGKSILAVPNHCLLLHVPRNVFQEAFLHDLHKDQSQAEFVEDGTCHYGLWLIHCIQQAHVFKGKGFTLLPSSPSSCVFETQ